MFLTSVALQMNLEAGIPILRDTAGRSTRTEAIPSFFGTGKNVRYKKLPHSYSPGFILSFFERRKAEGFSTQGDNVDVKRRLSHVYKVLIEHQNTSLYMNRRGLDLGDFSMVMLSIAILSERLEKAISDVHVHLGLNMPDGPKWRPCPEGCLDLGRPILELMRARGWCPYDLRRLDIEMTELTFLLFYSTLGAPRSSKDHGNCSAERCLAMMTDPATYKLSHRHKECQCPLISADQREVARILEQGSIPLVKLTQDPESKASRIIIIDAAQCQNFTAISHIWAEGAGSVQDNALHSCILEEISNLVSKLPWVPREPGRSDFAFWIDTLCVPVRPPELQSLALNNMRVPYERASGVLVLDAHLRSFNSTVLSHLEIFAQVSCSSWMRRLWTLQEGKLAQKVWFQFANKAVDVEILDPTTSWQSVPWKIDVWMSVVLFTHLWIQIWYRQGTLNGLSAVASMIRSTRHALRSRSASVSTDEALCLSTLMNKDLTRIIAVPPAQRMEVFWRTFERVPRSLVFSEVSKKMPQQGLHWAPSSFMSLRSEEYWTGTEPTDPRHMDYPHAFPTSEGLQVALPGLRFHQGLLTRSKAFAFIWESGPLFHDECGIWYLMRFGKPWREGSATFETSQQLTVILAHGLRTSARAKGLPSEKLVSQDISEGVLGSVARIEDDTMYFTAHIHVKVKIFSQSTQRYLSIASSCVHDAEVQHSVLLNESDAVSKQLYKKAAERHMNDPDSLLFLRDQARHWEMGEGYEDLLDRLLDLTVKVARLGDCLQVQRLPEGQQWCVD
ncbi:MAG: hypothetical protein L6R39_000366 [Caloplaca ligustica]|nr:MAG: hypothetical protein L6R39_000366 [Caloplaca ligustica]